MSNLFTPLLRAVNQLHDPIFLGVMVRSLFWTVSVFAALLAAIIFSVHHLLAIPGWWSWLVDLIGGIATALLASWLFLPLAVGIGTLFIDRIADAVEHFYYPHLPRPRGESLSVQLWDGVAVGLRVLLLSFVALILTLLLPGIGALLGWAISGWAIGRGLFVAVAMRRMSRRQAESLHRHHRGRVLLLGGVLAAMAFLPPLNLLLPVLGVAAMVHLLQSLVGSATDFAG
jgi:uncharacterized protein involved in cysteine biosynthesis